MIVSLCLISAILCKFFESSFSEFKMIVSICCCTVGFITVCSLVSPICNFIIDMMNSVGADIEYSSILFKSAAISMISQLGSDVCRDARETALATLVEAAGRISLAAMSIVLLSDIANIVWELTK